MKQSTWYTLSCARLTTELGAMPSPHPAHFVPYFVKKSSLQKTSLFFTKHFSLSGCAHDAQLRHFACQGWSTTLRMNLSRIRPPHDPHFGMVASNSLFCVSRARSTSVLSPCRASNTPGGNSILITLSSDSSFTLTSSNPRTG